MKLLHGYEISKSISTYCISLESQHNDFCHIDSSPGQTGHVICPPLLSTKITLSSAANTNRWVFYGTRKQILEWMREHGDISLENAIFVGGKVSDNNVHTELVIDLQYVYDQEQGYYDYFKSYFVSIYDAERVKVEIRPRVDSKDGVIPSLSRIIVASGSKLNEITDDLEVEWFKPAQSYVQQAVHLFTDAPISNHILSAKPPSSIQVTTTEDIQPTSTVNAHAPSEVDLSASGVRAN
jgi:hypothetical protein